MKPDFATRVQELAEQGILKVFSEGQWIEPNYHNRVKVPADFMGDVWALVDTTGIKAQLAKRIEAELADRIMNHLAAEMASDIKQLLSNSERREALRALARQHLDILSKPITTP